MGWEQRGKHLYYYRKRRMGRNVSSEYVGNGLPAQFLSALDNEEHGTRRSALVEWGKQKREIKTLEADMQYLNQMATSLVKALLLTTGYHPHKGQWRKKRYAK